MPLASDPLWCHRCGINSTKIMNPQYAPIKKTGPFVLSPNLMSYEAAQSTFSWDSAELLIGGLPGSKLNIAHEAVDRHARGPGGQRTALRWLGRKGEVRDLSYAWLVDAVRVNSSVARINPAGSNEEHGAEAHAKVGGVGTGDQSRRSCCHATVRSSTCALVSVR